MTTPTHTVCEVCKKPVKVIRRPDQRAARVADHGQLIWQLCPGAGMPVEAEAEAR